MTHQQSVTEFLLRTVRQLERDQAAVVAILDVLSDRGYQNPYRVPELDHMFREYEASFEAATVLRKLEKAGLRA